jgi:hypothetical protein
MGSDFCHYKNEKEMKILLYLSLAMALINCTESKVNEEDWRGGKIDKEGTYFIKNKRITIQVFVDKEGLVQYTVENQQGNLIQSKGHFSAYQKWWLFWDNKTDNLWVESSDIGSVLWKKSGTSYTRIEGDETSDLYKQLPQEAHQYLSNSIKEILAKDN